MQLSVWYPATHVHTTMSMPPYSSHSHKTTGLLVPLTVTRQQASLFLSQSQDNRPPCSFHNHKTAGLHPFHLLLPTGHQPGRALHGCTPPRRSSPRGYQWHRVCLRGHIQWQDTHHDGRLFARPRGGTRWIDSRGYIVCAWSVCVCTCACACVCVCVCAHPSWCGSL